MKMANNAKREKKGRRAKTTNMIEIGKCGMMKQRPLILNCISSLGVVACLWAARL